jgi:hypothetical protein
VLKHLDRAGPVSKFGGGPEPPGLPPPIATIANQDLTTASNEAIIRKSANAVALATWDRLLLLVARPFTSNAQSKR